MSCSSDNTATNCRKGNGYVIIIILYILLAIILGGFIAY